MEPIKLPLGLTFDDVLLLPGLADFKREDIDLSTNFTKKIKLTLPLVSAPMDTVTDSKLAIALGKLGGIGVIHRNLSIEDQVEEVIKVKKLKLIAAAAVGAGSQNRVNALIRGGVDAIIVDSAHGFAKTVIDTIIFIKKTYPKVEVIGGSIATADAALALIKAGADGLRVGMGPGAICTTRIISGMGVPQITAIMETVKIAKKFGVPVIADGGIKYSGDMVKAIAAGASTVMMGSFFSSCVESPGRSIALTREFVPKRFLSVFNNNKMLLDPNKKSESKKKNELTITGDIKKTTGKEVFYFKEYRGMGSEAAMHEGARIKSEGEFHGKSYEDKVLVAEGVEGLVPIKGTVKDLVDQAIGGIKSGMYYTGAKNIKELWKAKFIQITQASLTESHPHDVLITNPGENYL